MSRYSQCQNNLAYTLVLVLEEYEVQPERELQSPFFCQVREAHRPSTAHCFWRFNIVHGLQHLESNKKKASLNGNENWDPSQISPESNFGHMTVKEEFRICALCSQPWSLEYWKLKSEIDIRTSDFFLCLANWLASLIQTTRKTDSVYAV